jgi:hypothetical protein
MRPRPFVINRDVLFPDSSDQRKILVDVSEYDGVLEDFGVQPLNRNTVAAAIREWERDEDYMIDSEYDIEFSIQYTPFESETITVSYHFGPSTNSIVGAQLREMEERIDRILVDLDQPLTEVVDLSIYGYTSRKMWYRISSQTIDFTPV